jgi:hypothetical protein
MADDADVPQMIFIAGLHRSGTSMLEHFLHSHLDVSVLRGPVAENEGQFFQDVYPLGRDYGGPGRFAFAPEMHLDAPPDELAQAYRSRLLECWQPHIVGSADVLMEKSPPNITKIPWLRKVFPGSRFLVVVRDPRAVALATQKWSGTTLAELMLHWHAAQSSAHAALSDDCTVVRYEDFCENPLGLTHQLSAKWHIPLRSQPLDLADRFAIVSNVNAAYLRAFPNLYFGPGAWQKFGYEL